MNDIETHPIAVAQRAKWLETVAEDRGQSVDEARAEWKNSSTFIPTAKALVAEADADPDWWDRRYGETPREHGQRLKRLCYARSIARSSHAHDAHSEAKEQ